RSVRGASRRATRAAVLPGAARRQRHADRRHAKVELSADLAPEGGVHAAGAPDLGGGAATRAVTEDAVVRLSVGPGAGGVGGRSRRRREGALLRDRGEAREATGDALKDTTTMTRTRLGHTARPGGSSDRRPVCDPRILAFSVSSALSKLSALSMTVVTLT